MIARSLGKEVGSGRNQSTNPMVPQRREALVHPSLCVCIAEDQVEGDEGEEAEEDGPLDDMAGL